MLIVFWLSFALIIYAYCLFPVLIYLRARFSHRPYRKANIQPSVSLVMAVHNEENEIEAKLENIRSIDYPTEKLEIIIASDGSTDKTNDLLQANATNRMHVLLLTRVGKAKALNTAVEQSSGEILVFSDANSIYRPDAIRKLVASFADPSIGGVAGNQVYRSAKDANLSQSGEKSYWNFDRVLKGLESHAGNVISATGSIYAIRRSLFQPIIEGVTDDFYTSTAAIEQGFRLVFEEDAVSYEPVSSDANREFSRKVRIMTRGLRAVMARRTLLNPFRYGFYAIQLFSHKVLRRLVVFPLLLMFIASLFLVEQGLFYWLAAAGQAAFYASALLGGGLQLSHLRYPKLIKYPYYFCLVNAASLVAVLNILRGAQIARWEPQRVSAQNRNSAS